jgi:hypothetical protein
MDMPTKNPKFKVLMMLADIMSPQSLTETIIEFAQKHLKALNSGDKKEIKQTEFGLVLVMSLFVQKSSGKEVPDIIKDAEKFEQAFNLMNKMDNH